MSTARIARASTTILATAVVAAGLVSGCRGNNQQAAQTTPPPALSSQSSHSDGETPESRFAVDVRAAELAEREADVARREAELARRQTRPPVAAPPRVAVKPRVPAPPPQEPQEPSSRQPVPAEPARRTVTVTSGTGISAEMESSLSSATSAVGDSVSARVAENVYADGALAIPAGSRLYGTVSDAHGLRNVGGQARLAIDFTRLELPSGEDVPFAAGYAMSTRSETPKDVATIGGAAAAGAVLGHNVYKRDRDKGRVLGAILGGAIGTVVATKTRGGEIDIPAGTVLDLALDGSVSVRTSA